MIRTPFILLAMSALTGCTESDLVLTKSKDKTAASATHTIPTLDLRQVCSGKQAMPESGVWRLDPEWIGMPTPIPGFKNENGWDPEPYRFNRLTVTSDDRFIEASGDNKVSGQTFFSPAITVEEISKLKKYPEFLRLMGEGWKPFDGWESHEGYHWRTGWQRCFPTPAGRLRVQHITADFIFPVLKTEKPTGGRIDWDAGIIESLEIRVDDFRPANTVTLEESRDYPSEDEKAAWYATKAKEAVAGKPEPLRNFLAAKLTGAESYAKALDALRLKPDAKLISQLASETNEPGGVRIGLPYSAEAVGKWHPSGWKHGIHILLSFGWSDLSPAPDTPKASRRELSDKMIDAVTDLPSPEYASAFAALIMKWENIREIQIERPGVSMHIVHTDQNSTTITGPRIDKGREKNALESLQKALRDAATESRARQDIKQPHTGYTSSAPPPPAKANRNKIKVGFGFIKHRPD